MQQTTPKILPHLATNDVELYATDGQRLAATWFRHAATQAAADLRPEAVCIIAPAIGVPRRFYNDLGSFLARLGFIVLTLDFRGFGDSASHPLYFENGFSSFGLDVGTAIRAAQRAYPGVSLTYIGHSLGGHALGYCDGNNAVSRAVIVGSGSGYYGWSPFPENVLRYVFWRTAVPAVTRAVGYYPGRSLGILGDIPKPIMLEWARLCRRPGFFRPRLSDPPLPPFQNFAGQLAVISLSDDRIMPKAATDELARNYAGARVTRLHIAPRDIGLHRVGHLSALKTGEMILWPAMARWLNGGDWALLPQVPSSVERAI